MAEQPKTLELEALVVRIIGDVSSYVASSNVVRQTTGRIVASLKALETQANKLSNSISTKFAGIGTAANSMTTALQGVTGAGIGAAVQQLGKDLEAVSNTQVVNGLTRLATSIGSIGGANVKAATDNLTMLGAGLQKSRLGTVTTERVSTNINNLSKSLSGFARLPFVNMSVGVGGVTIALSDLNNAFEGNRLGWISTGKAVSRLNDLSKAMRVYGRLDATNMTAAGTAVGNSIAAISNGFNKTKLAGAKIPDAIKNLESLKVALAGLRIGSTVAKGMEDLAVWLPKVSAVLGTAGTAKTGIGIASAVVGKGITNLGNLANSLAGVTAANPGPALKGLGTGIFSLGQQLNSSNLFSKNATSAIGNLSTLTTALAQFGGVNVNQAVLAITGLTQQIPGLTAAITSSGLGAPAIKTAAINLTLFATATQKLGAVNIPTFQKSAATLSRWFNSLGSFDSGKLNTLMQMGRASHGLAALATALGQTNAKLPPINNNFNLVAKSTRGAANAAMASTTPFSRLTSHMSNLGRIALGTNTSMAMTRLTIGAFAALSVFAFSRFDTAMARTLARMGEFSNQRRNLLGQGIMDLSVRTGADTGRLAAGLGVLHAAGMNQLLSMQALPIAESLGLAGDMEVDQAARRLTSVVNAMGLAGRDATSQLQNLNRVADVFVRTSQLVDVSVEDISESFNARLAGSLRQVNWSLEQGAGLMAAYATANVRGSDAGNRAANMLQSLNHAILGNAEAWEKLGLTTTEFSQLMRQGPAGIIDWLNKRLADHDPLMKQAILEWAGFDTRVTQAIIPLLGFSNLMRDTTVQLQNAAGASEQAANSIRMSFGQQVLILWANLKVLAAEIGEVLAPAFAWLAENIRDFVAWFRALDQRVRSMIVWSSVIAAAVPILLFLKGILVTVVGGVFSLGIAFAAFAGSILTVTSLFIGLGVAAAAVLATLAGGGLMMVMGGLERAATVIFTVFSRMPGPIGLIVRLIGDFHNTVEELKGTFQTLLGFFFNFSENMHELFEWFANEYRTGFQNSMQIVSMVMMNAQNNTGVVLRIISAALLWLRDNMGNIFEDMRDLFSRTVEAIVNLTMILIDILARLWRAFWETEFVNAIKAGLQSVWDSFIAFFRRLGDELAAIAVDVGLAMGGDARAAARIVRRFAGGGAGAQVLGLNQAAPAPPREVRGFLQALGLADNEVQRFADILILARRDLGQGLAFATKSPFYNFQPRTEPFMTNQRVIDQALAAQALSQDPITSAIAAAAGAAGRAGSFEGMIQQFRPLMQPTDQMVARRVAEVVGVIGGPGGPMAGLLPAARPFVDLPQFRTDIPSIRATPPVPEIPRLAAAMLGGVSPLAGVLPTSNILGNQLTLAGEHNVIPWMRFNTMPAGSDGDFNMPQISPHGGGHSEFMQTSFRRVMLGGPVAQQIEEQSVRDNAVASRLDTIATVVRNSEGHLSTISRNTDRRNNPPAPPSDLP